MFFLVNRSNQVSNSDVDVLSGAPLAWSLRAQIGGGGTARRLRTDGRGERRERSGCGCILDQRLLIDVACSSKAGVDDCFVADTVVRMYPNGRGIRPRGNHGEATQGGSLRGNVDHISERRPALRGRLILVGEYELLIGRYVHVIASSV
jgi:hypothetical protein